MFVYWVPIEETHCRWSPSFPTNGTGDEVWSYAVNVFLNHCNECEAVVRSHDLHSSWEFQRHARDWWPPHRYTCLAPDERSCSSMNRNRRARQSARVRRLAVIAAGPLPVAAIPRQGIRSCHVGG